jgi:ppGpp synthetase/RelA/SpoT-type nucleotidyltranferase
MIPAELSTQHGLLSAQLKLLLDFFRDRLTSDLSHLKPIRIEGRVKEPSSILQKLETGKYDGVAKLSDLIGLTVVLLHRRDVGSAIEVMKSSGLPIVGESVRAVEAADFRYREPKLYFEPPVDYLDRNPDFLGFVAEVQFTSVLQHALDATTHDFDYKGKTYSWRNFRLVAQLRGMLELVDNMIDDIDNVEFARSEIITPPAHVVYAAAILDVLTSKFEEDRLPPDRRRFADTVASWCDAISIDAGGLASLLDRQEAFLNTESLDATSAVLGALLKEYSGTLPDNFAGHFVVGSELASLCPETQSIAIEKRVQLSWQNESN